MIRSLSIGNLLLGTYASGFLIEKHSGFGMPSLKVDMKDRGHYSGANLGNVYYGRRSLTIDGEIIGLTEADYEAKRQLIAKELDATRGLRTLTIRTHNGLEVTVDVILAQAIDMPYEKGKMIRGKYQLTFIAESPFFQGNAIHEQQVAIYEGGGFAIPFALPLDISAGEDTTATITNEGNGYVYPTFTVYGGCTNPSVANLDTGETFNISRVLGSSDFVVVDAYNHTAMLNGDTNITHQVSGDWLRIQPGANQIRFSTGAPDATARVEFSYKDTYIGI